MHGRVEVGCRLRAALVDGLLRGAARRSRAALALSLACGGALGLPSSAAADVGSAEATSQRESEPRTSGAAPAGGEAALEAEASPRAPAPYVTTPTVAAVPAKTPPPPRAPAVAAVTSTEPATAGTGLGAAALESTATPGVVAANAPETLAAGESTARDLSLPPPSERRWQLMGDILYRTLAVTDRDPANDRRVIYRAQGNYEILPGLNAFLRMGIDQRFVRVDDESGMRFEDIAFGAFYVHALSLAPLGWDRTVGLFHRFRAYLPTGFESQQQDLYTALEWTSRARVNIVDQLFAGGRGVLQYRFHEYAEQAGPGGGTLPRFVAEAQLFVEYSPIVSARYGTLTVGADTYFSETVDYPARDPRTITAAALPPGTLDPGGGSIGAGGATTFAGPGYGFDLYATYAPRPYLMFTASLEQGGSVLSNGGPHVYLFNRDETAVGLRATAIY